VLVVIGLALILGTLKLLRDRNRIAQETNDLLARHVPCSDRSGPAMGIPRRPENAAEGKCKLTVGPGPPTVRDVRAVRIDRAPPRQGGERSGKRGCFCVSLRLNIFH
jgi:hypothetical protein